MTINIQHLTDNWKSTVQSMLTVTFMITGYLLASSTIKPHTAAILGTVNAIAKIILGVMQQDGSTVVVPPGSTVSQLSSTVVHTV